MADGHDDLLFDISGHVATITLNRPAKLNTMTPEMGHELARISERINADATVRVVVLQGQGERAFSAGSDIKVLDGYGSNWELRNRVDYAREIWRIRKPVVAKIRGYCIGGGLELALMSDVRFADGTAQFGAGEIKLGWLGGAGNTQLLPRVIGPGKALQLLLTGQLIKADEAYRFGLVQELTSPTSWTLRSPSTPPPWPSPLRSPLSWPSTSSA
jgi:enoyl-CoA hydratase/carnithine racemase